MNVKKIVYSNWLFVLLYILFFLSFRMIKNDELVIIVIPSFVLLLFFVKTNIKMLSFLIPIFGIYQFWVIEKSYYWLSILILLLFVINGSYCFLLKKNRIKFMSIDWAIILLGIISWLIMLMVKMFSPLNSFSFSDQYSLLILPIFYLFVRISTVKFIKEKFE